jgi:hypothetical protein
MFDEDEEQMKEEDEGEKTKLDVGGTPLITVNLCKTNVFYFGVVV